MLTGVAGASRSRTRPRSIRVPAEAWPVLAITAAALAVRIVNLTSQSYWFDEAQAVHEMRSSFHTMVHLWSANEPNPPVWFVITWGWARIFGTGEAGLRSLSVLFGTLTVPVVYLCGSELGSRRAGLAAAALAAINPFLIWYSQEAREYILLTLLSAGSLLFFARAWRTGARRDVLWWAVVSALALGTQYFAGFLAGAEALLLLWRLRNRTVLAGWGLLLVVEAALVPHLLGHAAHPGDWIQSVGPLSVRARQVPVAFAVNTLYKGAPAVLTWGLIGTAILLALVIGLLLVGAPDRQLRGAGLAAALGAAVVLVPLALAVAGRDYYEARALIGGWVPLAVAVAIACAAPRARVAGTALLVALAALFVWGTITVQYGNPTYRKQDWRGAAQALGSAPGTRAIVPYDGQFAAPSLAIYLPRVPWTGSGQTPQDSTAPVRVSEIDVVADEYVVVASHLPRGVRVISDRVVDGERVVRFALRRPRTATPAALGAEALRLAPGPAGVPPVLIQHGANRATD